MSTADEVRSILQSFDDIFMASDASSPCIFSTYDEEVQTDSFGGSKQTIRRTSAVVCTDDYPALAEEDAVTVNGVAYTVLDVRVIQDGHMMLVNLQKA